MLKHSNCIARGHSLKLIFQCFCFRWNVSEFSSCSKSCGGGIQTRGVSCIQEVRHGGNNILRVDDAFCPQPPPITQQFCSVVDCPVMWKTGPWSKVRTVVSHTKIWENFNQIQNYPESVQLIKIVQYGPKTSIIGSKLIQN